LKLSPAGISGYVNIYKFLSNYRGLTEGRTIADPCLHLSGVAKGVNSQWSSSLREAAGLRPDTPLEIRHENGLVEIEPALAEVRIEVRGGVAVAVPVEPVPPVTTEEVEAVRRTIREEREDRAL
jgi:hypothetical protein